MDTDALGRRLFNPDLNAASIPHSVKMWRPKIYEDAGQFYCSDAESPWQKICGCGSTPQLAMEDWDRDWHREMDAIGDCVCGLA